MTSDTTSIIAAYFMVCLRKYCCLVDVFLLFWLVTDVSHMNGIRRTCGRIRFWQWDRWMVFGENIDFEQLEVMMTQRKQIETKWPFSNCINWIFHSNKLQNSKCGIGRFCIGWHFLEPYFNEQFLDYNSNCKFSSKFIIQKTVRSIFFHSRRHV